MARTERALSQLIEATYAAAAEPPAWSELLRQLADFIGASTCHLLLRNPVHSIIESRGVGTSPSEAARYVRDVSANDELLNAVEARRAGRVVLTQDFLSEADIPPMLAYQQWYGPMGLGYFGAAFFGGNTRCQAWLGLARARASGPFPETSRQLLAALMPHLDRAFAITEKLADAHQLSQLALDAIDQLSLGVVFIAESGKVRLANAQASRMAEAGLIRLNGHSLSFVDRRADQRLRDQLAAIRHQAAVGDALPFSLDAGGGYLVHCLPYQGSAAQHDWLSDRLCAAVFIIDTRQDRGDIPEHQLRQAFALTPGEARVLQYLMTGLDVAAIANRLGVSSNAIRYHLKNIYRKVGVNRQSSLVALVSRSLGQLAGM